MATKKAAAKSAPNQLVEMRAPDSLTPYANNAKIHDDSNVSKIAESIRTFGFTIPILVDEDGVVIAGHGRLLAAKQLKMAEVPTIVARGWTEPMRRAYTIRDNTLAESSAWDFETLKLELADLTSNFDFGLAELGFDDSFLTSTALDLDIDLGGAVPAETLTPSPAPAATVMAVSPEAAARAEFKPELAPTTQHREVTDAQVVSAEQRLTDAPAQKAQQDLIDAMCPGCGHEFYVSRT